MGKGDTAVKQWLKNKTRFADLFNGIVFQGENIVRPEELEMLETESSVLLTDKNGKRTSVQRYRDIIMRWKKGVNLAILACENQEKVHYAMPVRMMLYDGLSYIEQIKQIWEQRKERQEKAVTRSEFLSRFRKDDRLYPIISLVFYYGSEKWDGSMDLYGMFHWDETLRSQKVLAAYIPNYPIHVVDVGALEDVKRFQSDLQIIFGMLRYRGKKKELEEYLNENQSYFSSVDIETYQAVRELLHSEHQLRKVGAGQEKEGKVDMCKALEDIFQDGVEQGIEQGIEKGIEQGIEQGIEKGIEQGGRMRLIEMVCRKIQKGKTAAEAAEDLDEDLTQVSRIYAAAEAAGIRYDKQQIYRALWG